MNRCPKETPNVPSAGGHYDKPPRRNILMESMIATLDFDLNCNNYHQGCDLIDKNEAMTELEQKFSLKDLSNVII